MKKIIAFAMLFVLIFSLVGCGDTNNDVMNNGNKTTEETTLAEPEKTELSAEDFISALGSSKEYEFKTELNSTVEDLALFPYTGLKYCVLVSLDDVSVASFFVFDNEENAQTVLDEAKSENTTGFDDTTGKNFESVKQGSVVIERVGTTVLNIAAEEEAVTQAILAATEY
ncbi:MAG: hypothetical protein IJV39_00820 [Ruminococcus sp.]|nr:hypothetical protein [Ruminococcus sp.]